MRPSQHRSSGSGTIRSGSQRMNGSLVVASIPCWNAGRCSFVARGMTWWKRWRLAAIQLRTSAPDALSTIVSRYGSRVRASRASTVATRWSRRL